MTYLHWIAGTLLAVIWTSRLLDAARGMPRVADISQPQWDPKRTPGAEPRVSIIVPARNEREHIEDSLVRLLHLDYDNYEVIVVNDRSSDGTGERVMEVAERAEAERAEAERRLKVIHVTELPRGWLGKVHAMWTGAEQASGEWLLFTDADVLFRPDSLRRALFYAQSEQADHLVILPHIILESPGERTTVAFFQTLFVFGHRPWKVADPQARDHMGIGAFNLIRRPVYEALGTFQVLRLEVLDDMKLGKLVKEGGYRQRNVFGHDLVSLRWVEGVTGMVNNLSKNFFALMSFQWPRALASALALAYLNVTPFLGIWLAQGWARLPYAIALASLFAIYVGMSSKSDVPAYYFFLHALSATLFLYILLSSTLVTLVRGGVLWRGTFYPLEELKRGIVPTTSG
ncbi:MAG TPA: glycosyltransferase family 2 protein [Terriglobales bacterium]|nr:glycosyltransferase family 2 protein [Terriglobales bacterium]